MHAKRSGERYRELAFTCCALTATVVSLCHAAVVSLCHDRCGVTLSCHVTLQVPDAPLEGLLHAVIARLGDGNAKVNIKALEVGLGVKGCY